MERLMGVQIEELGAELDKRRCELAQVIREIAELDVQKNAHADVCQACLSNAPSCSDGLWFDCRIKQKGIVREMLKSECDYLESKIVIYGIPKKGPDSNGTYLSLSSPRKRGSSASDSLKPLDSCFRRNDESGSFALK
jgi:hypothetical protein